MPADRIDPIAGCLAEPERGMSWLEDLAGLDPAADLTLADDRAAEVLLARLRVPAVDRRAMLAARPTPSGSPYLWWLLARAHRQLLDGMGRAGADLPWPALAPALGDA